MKLKNFAGALIFAFGTLAVAQAGTFGEPPPLNPILDLNGTPMGEGNYQPYSVNFNAILSDTVVTIALRDDPDYLELANVSVVDLTTPSGNLLANGDFSGGTWGDGYPDGWNYANIYGASFPGMVYNYCGQYATCWFDGSVGGYDAISQTIGTTLGDQYQLSFDLASLGGGEGYDYSTYATNVAAYALGGLPDGGGATPEPSTALLIGGGLVATGLARRRKKK